jgi:hypothetical protein
MLRTFNENDALLFFQNLTSVVKARETSVKVRLLPVY